MRKNNIKKSFSFILSLIVFFSGLYIQNADVRAADAVGDSLTLESGGITAPGAQYNVEDYNGDDPIGFRFGIVRSKKDSTGNEGRHIKNAINVYKSNIPSKYSVKYKPTSNAKSKAKSKAEWAEIIANNSNKSIGTEKIVIGTASKITYEKSNFGGYNESKFFNLSEFENVFKTPGVQKAICSKITSNETWDELKTQYIITAEPLYKVEIGGTVVYATPTDLAVIYWAYAGNKEAAQANAGAKITFIGNPVRRNYPVALYVHEGTLNNNRPRIWGLVGVAEKASFDGTYKDGTDRPEALSCNTIILNAYGVGMAYDEGSHNPTPKPSNPPDEPVNPPTTPPAEEPDIKIQYKVDPRFAIRNDDLSYTQGNGGLSAADKFGMDPFVDSEGKVFRVFVLHDNRELGSNHYVRVWDKNERLSTVVEAGGFVPVKSGKNGMKIRYDNYHHAGWKVLKSGSLQGDLIEDGDTISYNNIKKYKDSNNIVTLQSVPEINKCYVQYSYNAARHNDGNTDLSNGGKTYGDATIGVDGYKWKDGYIAKNSGERYQTIVEAEKLASSWDKKETHLDSKLNKAPLCKGSCQRS